MSINASYITDYLCGAADALGWVAENIIEPSLPTYEDALRELLSSKRDWQSEEATLNRRRGEGADQESIDKLKSVARDKWNNYYAQAGFVARLYRKQLTNVLADVAALEG